MNKRTAILLTFLSFISYLTLYAQEEIAQNTQFRLNEVVWVSDANNDELEVYSSLDSSRPVISQIPSGSIARIVSLPELREETIWYEVIVLRSEEIQAWVNAEFLYPFPRNNNSEYEALCPNAAGFHFSIGQQFIVPYGDGATSVWTEPNSEPRVGYIEEGTGGIILDGPVCKEGQRGNLMTWYVEADNGLTGWVSEGYQDALFPWIVPLVDERSIAVFSSIPVAGSTIDFGSVEIGNRSILSIEITNTGTNELVVNRYSIEGGDGVITLGGETRAPFLIELAPSETLIFEFSCAPEDDIDYEASIIFEHNGSEEAEVFVIRCQGS
jgi:hypothetical protein